LRETFIVIVFLIVVGGHVKQPPTTSYATVVIAVQVVPPVLIYARVLTVVPPLLRYNDPVMADSCPEGVPVPVRIVIASEPMVMAATAEAAVAVVVPFSKVSPDAELRKLVAPPMNELMLVPTAPTPAAPVAEIWMSLTTRVLPTRSTF
jgi:hypothetical protein